MVLLGAFSPGKVWINLLQKLSFSAMDGYSDELRVREAEHSETVM